MDAHTLATIRLQSQASRVMFGDEFSLLGRVSPSPLGRQESSILTGALHQGVLMIYRLAIGVLAALAVAIIVPAQGHADPPTKCLTNTPKGKQVYVPCDLLNAGANFPPGQRCPLPLEQYPKDVADWCGEGPGLASPTPASRRARRVRRVRQPRRARRVLRDPDESYNPDESCEPEQ